MAEAHIGLLYNAASTLLQRDSNQSQFILRSHYLMRCMTITKGYGLPDKHFSINKRCSHCCMEWQTDTKTRIKSIKLSKRQKKRMKSRKSTTKDPNTTPALHSKELERICTFCGHSTVTPILKPAKKTITIKKEDNTLPVAPSNTPKQNKSQTKHQGQKKAEASIYYNAKEVFSLKNKNNSLVKANKVIKNNKRKKDRFAGLCQQAVLTSVKLREAKDKNNLLSKFLKTSS